jgi:hypothetical protein
VGADIRHVFKEITFGTKSRPEPETTTSDGRDMVACVFDKHAMEGSLGVENKMEAAPEDVVSNPTVDTPR